MIYCRRVDRTMKSLKLASLVLLLCCVNAFAQFETAVVLGTARDSSQATVGGSKITLVHIATGIQGVETTDENGNYLFNNVKIGRYKVTAEKAGFTTAVANDFQVDVNARQRVDLTLAVGQVAESVQVNASVMVVEGDSTERGQVINQQQIVEL